MLLSSSVGLGLLEVKTFPSPLTDYNCKTTVLNDRPPPLVTGGTKFHNTFIEDFATIFSFQVLFNLFKRSFIFFLPYLAVTAATAASFTATSYSFLALRNIIAFS